MKTKSYTQLQEKYGGNFIAKINGRVIAASKSSKTLWNKITKKIGKRNLTIEYIEPKGAICIYGFSSP